MPPGDQVLPGISLAVLIELADGLRVTHVERELRPADVAAADEVWITSTSPCILPVVRFNGQPIGSGAPGATYRRFLAAWSDLVGLDVAAQAARFASR
jgi:branched-subunit amino acid aminotransferase/4-amino-4-deoxychorismate lyase